MQLLHNIITFHYYTQVWLLLFNDLLLITRKDGKIFTVQEEPIILDDLQLSDALSTSKPQLNICIPVTSFYLMIRWGIAVVRKGEGMIKLLNYSIAFPAVQLTVCMMWAFEIETQNFVQSLQ